MKIKMNPKTELIQKEYDLLLSHIKELKEIKNQDTTNFYSNLSYLQQNTLNKLNRSSISSIIERFESVCNYVLSEAFFSLSKDNYEKLKFFVSKKLKAINEISLLC